jgi:hypothetical protein
MTSPGTAPSTFTQGSSTLSVTPGMPSTPEQSLDCNVQELTAGAGLIILVDATVVAIPVVILVFVAPEAIAPYLEATEWLYLPANAAGATLIIHSGCVGEQK